jgi:hypothetical protein
MRTQAMMWVTGLIVLTGLTRVGTAAEPDKLLPADSNAIISLNVKQLMSSPFGKKFLAEQFKELIAGTPEVMDLLKQAEVDPVKDIDRINVGINTNSVEDATIIIRGQFAKDKVDAVMKKIASQEADKMSVVKIGGRDAYELKADAMPVFMLPAADGVIVASGSKTGLQSTLDRMGNRNLQLKNQALAALIAKADDNAAGYSVIITKGLLDGLGIQLPDQVQDLIGKIDSITGEVKAGQDITLSLTANTRDGEAAMQIGELLKLGLQAAPDLIGQQEELKAALPFVRALRVESQGKTATIRLTITQQMIENALRQ